MKGYSKIKVHTPFAQISRSNKEYPFLDQDVDLRLARPSSRKTQDHHHHHHQPPTMDDGDENKKRHVFFSGKSHDDDDGDGDDPGNRNGGERIEEILMSNYSVSSAKSYQENRGCNHKQQLERQSSTKSAQGAVKWAFSMRRSSSVNSERYCRIHDQPMSVDDDCDGHDYHYDNYDDYERNNSNSNNDGPLETRSMSMTKKKDPHHNGKVHVGSKVVKACKRLFSR